MGNLTANYSIEDFVVSRRHPEMLAEIKAGLTDLHKAKAFYLATFYLEPLVEVFGTPCQLLSGIRSEALNQAVGGSELSDHRYYAECGAGDICHPRVEAIEIWKALQNISTFGQLIYYPSQKFVHISLPSKRHVGDILVKDGGKYHKTISWPMVAK